MGGVGKRAGGKGDWMEKLPVRFLSIPLGIDPKNHRNKIVPTKN